MLTFSENELRVLGVLTEKSLTQPGSYPMTVNAVTAGANQLQNRDPITQLAESDVSLALRNLQHKGLVVQAAPSASARAVRFEHRAIEHFKWDRREQAVMTELILRGRQTAGELRTHAGRMTPLADLPAVTLVLEALKSHDPPFVEELAREPGRSANRFRHLLSGAVETPSNDTVTLETRVARLEAEVAELKRLSASQPMNP